MLRAHVNATQIEYKLGKNVVTCFDREKNANSHRVLVHSFSLIIHEIDIL